MRHNLQFDPDSTARMEAPSSPFPLASPESRTLRLRPAVARAISGAFCGAVDLTVLSGALIYLALWAGGARIAGNLIALLSIRISVGHFAALALCCVAWRTIFAYCGLYTWQHVQPARSVPGRVALATGASALIAGEIVSSLWHHGHFTQVAVEFWIAATAGVIVDNGQIGAALLHFRRIAITAGTTEKGRSTSQKNGLLKRPISDPFEDSHFRRRLRNLCARTHQHFFDKLSSDHV
jgi:hypothetical protein